MVTFPTLTVFNALLRVTPLVSLEFGRDVHEKARSTGLSYGGNSLKMFRHFVTARYCNFRTDKVRNREHHRVTATPATLEHIERILQI